MRNGALWATLAGVLMVLLGAYLYSRRGARDLGTPAQRATYTTLHTASLAAPALRAGLTADSAARATPALRRLLGTRTLVLAGPDGVLAEEGVDDTHLALLRPHLDAVTAGGEGRVLGGRDLFCPAGVECPLQAGVVVPLSVSGAVVGALAALAPSARAGLLRAAGEVAGFVSSQLELAELDLSRTRAVQAELRFLRAQISPHFVYNALTAIESYVRSDPERARELLLGFAEFTRYSYRSHSQYATLAEELRLVDTYLELERARFGDRLSVTLRIAPEVLGVAVPCLILQPIVENAVRHGLEGRGGRGRLTITGEDADTDAVITVEDDGVGMAPDRLRAQLAGQGVGGGVGAGVGGGVGLRNVDERLRAVYGPTRGLVFETAVGAGTKVTLRVPKFKVGVRAS